MSNEHDSTQPSDQPILNPVVRTQLILGRDKLIIFMHTLFATYIQKPAHELYPVDCRHSICSSNRVKLFNNFELWTTEGGKTTFLTKLVLPTKSNYICGICTDAVLSVHQDIRKLVWDALPSFFDLPPWKDLKDDI